MEPEVKLKRIKRERITLDLDQSEIFLSLIGLTEELHPLPLLLYILTSTWQGGSKYLVPSKSDPEILYEVDLESSFCSCPRNAAVRTCGHIKAMRLKSKIQFARASTDE